MTDSVLPSLAPAYGRERQLAELAVVFERVSPSVVVLQFDSPIEKRAVFSNLSGRAEGRGWSVAPGLGTDPFPVRRDTTERAFGRALNDALSQFAQDSSTALDHGRRNPMLPDGEARPAGRRRARAGPAPTEEASGMNVASVSEHASPPAVLGGVDAGGQNVHVASLSTALAERGAEVVGHTSAHRLVRQLARRSPVAVALDCSDGPAPRWLVDDVLAGIRDARSPIVALVAGDIDDAELLAVASVVARLGPLEPDDVQACLTAAGEGLKPPLTAQELENYVAAARANARTLRSLVELFRSLSRDQDAVRPA